MKTTKIKCPITGDFLLHVGSTSNDLVHIYEAENNRGFRYKRYRLDWTVFELSGGRFFSLDNDVLVEVQKVGDKWMLLSATEEEKEKVLSDYRERQFKLMLDMRMPAVKNANAKTISGQLQSVVPSSKPGASSFYLETRYEDDGAPEYVTDKNKRPTISAEDCPLVAYITGLKCVVDAGNLGEFNEFYDDVKIGDCVYEWDMGGWGSLSGRAGDVLFRNDEYISSRLLRMS